MPDAGDNKRDAADDDEEDDEEDDEDEVATTDEGDGFVTGGRFELDATTDN